MQGSGGFSPSMAMAFMASHEPGIAPLQSMRLSCVPERLIERQKFQETDVFYHCEGCRARSKATDLGSVLVAVQEFESPPSHPAAKKNKGEIEK
jgi:hypothetical protein